MALGRNRASSDEKGGELCQVKLKIALTSAAAGQKDAWANLIIKDVIQKEINDSCGSLAVQGGLVKFWVGSGQIGSQSSVGTKLILV